MPDTERKIHTPDERRQALVVHASVSGRTELIEPMLKELDLEINIRTLQNWASRRYRDEYEQIKQEYESYTRSRMADAYDATADLAIETAQEAMRQLRNALRAGDVTLKELPKAAQAAMVTAGIATDKGQLLTGNPTSRIGVSHDVGELTRELATAGVTILVPGADGQLKPVIDVQTKPDPTPALPAAT